LIESKSLLVLSEHSRDAFLGIARHEAVTLTIFVKFHSLISFDAFNVSLVEQCLIHVSGFKVVTYSRIQGKGKEKSPKRCELVVTGLTGDRHRSDRCQRSKCIWVDDPTRVPG
jgi:hypothetical protein